MYFEALLGKFLPPLYIFGSIRPITIQKKIQQKIHTCRKKYFKFIKFIKNKGHYMGKQKIDLTEVMQIMDLLTYNGFKWGLELIQTIKTNQIPEKTA